ncbi:MAG: DUF3592 domain-containing protein [Candidatus Obscuribacterales bacterium]|nr:DUF3592 domain-containing protein [Candidatus Obscuribacterales bacterium]
MGTTPRSPGEARKVFRILVTVFGCCLLAATVATIVSLFFVNDFISNSTHVDGEVVGLERGAKGSLAPVVRFKTANGEILQLQSFLSTSPALKVGDGVKVVYRTANPRDWQIDDWIHLYFWTLMGSIFMLAWAIATTVTQLVGASLIRKLERVSDTRSQ